MQVRACQLAFAGRIEKTLESGLTLPLVSLAGFALLKVEAFLDRGPETDGVDLLDLDAVLNHYEEVLEDPNRVIAEAGDSIAGALIESEDAGAFLLGRDLADLLPRDGFEPLEGFLNGMQDPYAVSVGYLIGPPVDDQEDHRLRERVVARFAAFEAGVRSVVG